MRRFILPFVFCLPAFPAAAAEAADELHYAVSWLEIPFARARARLQRENGEFSIRGESWAAGPMAIFFDYRGFAETHGEWGNSAPVPATHRNGGEFRGKSRSVQIRWENNGASPRSEADPPPDPDKVSPVPQNELAGAVDPFSAALAAGMRIGRDGVCGGSEKVWDGRRLADWTLVHLGAESVAPDNPNAWGGTAAVCELRMQKIGGFRRDSKHNAKAPPRVWIAEVRPGLWAPVRAEVYSRWGKVVARLELPSPSQSFSNKTSRGASESLRLSDGKSSHLASAREKR